MKIDSSNYSLFEKIEKITSTQNNIMWLDKENKIGYVFVEDMYSMLGELVYELDHANEEIEDLIRDRDENYTPNKVNYYDEYGISESDFH